VWDLDFTRKIDEEEVMRGERNITQKLGLCYGLCPILAACSLSLGLFEGITSVAAALRHLNAETDGVGSARRMTANSADVYSSRNKQW
jgi:hypothetical protein